MAQVKLLKVGTDGVPTENATTDEVTFTSYTITGGGPVLSGSGLNMYVEPISGVTNLSFNDPTTGVINFTAGNGIIDDIMLKERNNIMASTGAVIFPSVTDTAGLLDSFRVPYLAGIPSATPAYDSNGGYLVYDTTDKAMYVWDGTAWENMSIAVSAQNIDKPFLADTAGVTIRDAVYISSADKVSPADASVVAKSYGIGFALNTAASGAAVQVRQVGLLGGFTGLTPVARYYVSGTTPGAITATLPTATGHTITQVGYAKNATTLDIQYLQLGRRA